MALTLDVVYIDWRNSSARQTRETWNWISSTVNCITFITVISIHIIHIQVEKFITIIYFDRIWINFQFACRPEQRGPEFPVVYRSCLFILILRCFRTWMRAHLNDYNFFGRRVRVHLFVISFFGMSSLCDYWILRAPSGFSDGTWF